jgi:hypothetical protein
MITYCFMSKKVESAFELELLPDLEGFVRIRRRPTEEVPDPDPPDTKIYGSGSATPTIDNKLTTGSIGSILHYVSQIEMCGRPCFQSVFGLSLQKSVIGVGILGKYIILFT